MVGTGFGAHAKTWVHSLFEGILTNETRCLTCETVRSSPLSTSSSWFMTLMLFLL